MSPLAAVACWKLVELRAGVDPLTGAILPDPVSAGPSPADEAALEWALRVADATGGEVAVVAAGGWRCDGMLRKAIAAGAGRALRVAITEDQPSAAVAAALAAGIRRLVGSSGDGAHVVVCGDASLDRGSGSVPAFLAAELDVAQALGLVDLTIPPASTSDDASPAATLQVLRRLDGGRRERLGVIPPCVLSVEAATARLRRAPLSRLLAVDAIDIEVVGWSPAVDDDAASARRPELVAMSPFRPPSRVVPPPPAGLSARERIDLLTGVGRESRPARRLVLDPEEAADELLTALAEWGELALPEEVPGVGASRGRSAEELADSREQEEETEPA